MYIAIRMDYLVKKFRRRLDSPLEYELVLFWKLIFMHKIGRFSTLAKTTIKTLRYYEKEGLLIPYKIDNRGYRYYEASQLIDFAKIIPLRQIGLSISDIRKVFNNEVDLKSILAARRSEIERIQVSVI